MSKVLDPAKELRFTRSAQAVFFAIIGSILLTIGVTLLLVIYTVHTNDHLDNLPFPMWLIFSPWIPMIPCFWVCYHCAKYPYLIFSPIGIEVFPFWKPIKNFNLIEWGLVRLVDFETSRMTLHFTEEKTSGVVLSLSPLSKNSRILLKRALEGVMDQRKVKK